MNDENDIGRLEARTVVSAFIKAVCRHPDDLEIRVVDGSRTEILVAVPHPDDYGRVLGGVGEVPGTTQPRHLWALREIARVAYLPAGIDGTVELQERPRRSKSAVNPKFKAVRDWPSDRLLDLFNGLSDLLKMNCEVKFFPVTSSKSMMSVMVGQLPAAADMRRLEAALAILFDVIGSANGQRIVFELSTERVGV